MVDSAERQSPSETASVKALLKLDTSFNFTPDVVTRNGAIIDITKYIPVGCLRIDRESCLLSAEDWEAGSCWRAFAQPLDKPGHEEGSGHVGLFLLNTVQDCLFRSPVLASVLPLHLAGLIRMEFKSRDVERGQVRVYVLPEDVARGKIDRQNSHRKAMQILLGQLDTSQATWSGNWSGSTRFVPLNPLLGQEVKVEPSLFYLFNTLPSPKPDPGILTTQYAIDTMQDILDNDIEGLTARLHRYQRRSAALMYQRETHPGSIIDPRLAKLVDRRGANWYCDLDSGLSFREPRRYEGINGGILAETMGLGKTLICLALILATRDIPSQIPAEYSIGSLPVRQKTGSLLDMAACAIGRHSVPWKDQFARYAAKGYELTLCNEALTRGAGHYYLPPPPPLRETRHPIITPPRKIWLSTATLIVCPPNLVQQWRAEITKHTTGLKVLVLTSMKVAVPPVKELLEYDILLFSKQRFEREAKDGSDSQGRRQTTFPLTCNCSYIGSTRTRACVCFNTNDVYRSPLKDIHFKRMITDEGHTFGNASNNSKTEAMTVLDLMQVSSRWIVSGTPTQGLYGMESAIERLDIITSNTPASTPNSFSPTPISTSEIITEPENNELFYKQERKDLEKLGNIASQYLKARPWAQTFGSDDVAYWNQVVMQPRHGAKSRGNTECLRSTLEGMMIRHRPDDVMLDITLPPLTHTFVHLDGSVQNKLALNLFAVMIVTNAVTSERKDADYFFHPRQRKPLTQLVSNLRQASFFWSGFEVEHVTKTLEIAKKFLVDRPVPVTPKDERLLLQAIQCGENFLSNDISKAICQHHEMAMFIQNDFSDEVRTAWALNRTASNPTLMGATMVHTAQKYVDLEEWNDEDEQISGFAVAGDMSMNASYYAQKDQSFDSQNKNRGKGAKSKRRVIDSPALAGGVFVGGESSPRKRPRVSESRIFRVQSSSKHEDDPTNGGEELPMKRFSMDGNTSHLEDSPTTIKNVPLNEEDQHPRDQVRLFEDLTPRIQSSSSHPVDEPHYDASDNLPTTHATSDASDKENRHREGVSRSGEAVRPRIILRTKSSTPKLKSGGKQVKAKQKQPLNKSAPLKGKPSPAIALRDSSPFASASMISTASTKLSYLMDRIMEHQATEKILVFYEADHVAYYIAQALECLRIKHLIYAKSLNSQRKARYVVTFNQSPVFRVLLMDVSQAAFGLDLSAASRVYFVNPVFSPQVEAQAVKRAHRIGQTKPVFVETLILKGSIEEVILDRRKEMSSEEHKRCKNILDDERMKDWIRDISFLSLDDGEEGAEGRNGEEMARLQKPYRVFGVGERTGIRDPDADLVNVYDGDD